MKCLSARTVSVNKNGKLHTEVIIYETEIRKTSMNNACNNLDYFKYPINMDNTTDSSLATTSLNTLP